MEGLQNKGLWIVFAFALVAIAGLIVISLMHASPKPTSSTNYTTSISKINNSSTITTTINAVTNTTNIMAKLSYPIVATEQSICYNNDTQIACPSKGMPFYGQDAQENDGASPQYTLVDNGLVVYDNVTGLYWMRGPNMSTFANVSDKMTYAQALSYVAQVNNMGYGGYNDWRLPSIKDLYSLYLATGEDPGSYSTGTSQMKPFINTNYFNFSYGATAGGGAMGSRIIDAQYFSNTIFVINPAFKGQPQIFGVNFADGRIKGYFQVGANGEFEAYTMLVRGNMDYGINHFLNNGDGTITDQATGLMWARNDSSKVMTWQQALAYAQQANAEHYLNHSDWRVPNIKELQSILNYSNAPEYNGKPAANTNFFNFTPIIDENGNNDYGYYWSSTTHVQFAPNGQTTHIGSEADYISFGEALGWTNATNSWIDFHGAGAQRSDPKSTMLPPDATVHTVVKNGIVYAGHARGPEADAIRSFNFVRLVRNASS